MALVQRDNDGALKLLWREVVKTEEVPCKLRDVALTAPYTMVIIGGGTSSRPLVEKIREEMPSMGILMVDERDTTLQARERYWEHNKRTGWRKLLPASMQNPPAPVDDFVALILAERVLLA
jgi:RNase H-fold protein (predicted Holliday junction resolvase)